MSVVLPIISEFDGSGIAKAKQEFSQLEGAGKKAQFAIKKAALPAAAALTAVGVALFDATKGALEDAAAQDLLAGNLRRTTGATDAQIKANEDWISTQGRLLGVTDDELRPVLAKLAKATGDVTLAQQYANQAMDIAAATGKPLATVTDTIAKAMGGNLAALGKLAPEYRQLIKDGADFETVMSLIADTTGGAASDAANTAEGRFKRLKLTLSETKESIGAALIPAVEKVLPLLGELGDWASQNPGAFLAIAGAVAAVATAIVSANVAMGAWSTIAALTTVLNAALATSFTAVQVASGLIVFTAIIAGLVYAYAKFEWFRNGVAAVFTFIGDGVKTMVGNLKSAFEGVHYVFKTMFNGIASLWNNTIGKLAFTIPSWVPGIGGKGFDVPNIPMLANGGIVNSPTLALIGEKGPEAVVPLSRGGGYGGDTNVTIQVNGGDPNAVVDALRTYMFRNGSVPIRVTG